jgi:hypothetical protein
VLVVLVFVQQVFVQQALVQQALVQLALVQLALVQLAMVMVEESIAEVKAIIKLEESTTKVEVGHLVVEFIEEALIKVVAD